MAERSQTTVGRHQEVAPISEGVIAQSIVIATHGITTSQDCKNLLSAMMADLLTGKITDRVGNAVCNACGKILKTVELEQKYGKQVDKDGRVTRLIELTTPSVPPTD